MASQLHRSKLDQRRQQELDKQARRANSRLTTHSEAQNSEPVEYLYAYNNQGFDDAANDRSSSTRKPKKSKKKDKKKKKEISVSGLIDTISDDDDFNQAGHFSKPRKISYQEPEPGQEPDLGKESSSTLSDHGDDTPVNRNGKIDQENDYLFNSSSASDTASNAPTPNPLDDNISIMTEQDPERVVKPQTNTDEIYSRPQTALNDQENKQGDNKFSFIPGMDHIDSADQFVFTAAPFEFRDHSVKARITRDKKNKSLSGTRYYMHLEIPGTSQRCFLLSARKRKGTKNANYVISTEANPVDKDSIYCTGKLRSNTLGTRFVAYDNGFKPNTPEAMRSTASVRREMVMVMYETNILGFHGPRKMSVVIPGMDEAHERVECQPLTETESISSRFDRQDDENLVTLENKKPIWNEETQSFVLNFHGRVTMASVKNFQIIHEKDPNYIIMQFGRISEDVFTIDYKYPLCAFQAFVVALSSFDSKLACE